jgi:hypothetical protein
VKRVRMAPMMPKTIVIVRVYEASELFEPAATGSTTAHWLSPGKYWAGGVDMTSTYTREFVKNGQLAL